MEDYTKEGKKLMIDTGAPICPKCESHNISTEGFDPNDNTTLVTRIVTCQKCGESWEETFKLFDVKRLEKARKMETKKTPPENQADRETWDFTERLIIHILELGEEVLQLQVEMTKTEKAFKRHKQLLKERGYNTNMFAPRIHKGIICRKPPSWLVNEPEFLE